MIRAGCPEGIWGSEWEDKAAERVGRPAMAFMNGSIRLKVSQKARLNESPFRKRYWWRTITGGKE